MGHSFNLASSASVLPERTQFELRNIIGILNVVKQLFKTGFFLESFDYNLWIMTFTELNYHYQFQFQNTIHYGILGYTISDKAFVHYWIKFFIRLIYETKLSQILPLEKWWVIDIPYISAKWQCITININFGVTIMSHWKIFQKIISNPRIIPQIFHPYLQSLFFAKNEYKNDGVKKKTVLGHSKLISYSTGPTDRNFRENKKIIILISSQNKK